MGFEPRTGRFAFGGSIGRAACLRVAWCRTTGQAPRLARVWFRTTHGWSGGICRTTSPRARVALQAPLCADRGALFCRPGVWSRTTASQGRAVLLKGGVVPRGGEGEGVVRDHSSRVVCGCTASYPLEAWAWHEGRGLVPRHIQRLLSDGGHIGQGSRNRCGPVPHPQVHKSPWRDERTFVHRGVLLCVAVLPTTSSARMGGSPGDPQAGRQQRCSKYGPCWACRAARVAMWGRLGLRLRAPLSGKT